MASAPNLERLVELEAACAAHASEARRYTIKLRRQSPALKLATLEVCLENDLPSLTRLLLADGVPLASRFENGDTVLHKAAGFNALRVLRLLLDSGADTNAKDVFGQTALHNAAHFGHLEAATVLLDAHAQINVSDNDGWTAIMKAADERLASVCELLASRGADLLATSADGRTAIHVAAEEGHADVVKVLLPHLRRLGISEDVRTSQSQLPEDKARMYGLTALHIACQAGHHSVARMLLAAGASRTATNSVGFTPLHCAAGYGHLACLTLMMGHPGAYLLRTAELDFEDVNGETPLYWAAYFGQCACCAAFIAAGADTAKAKPDGSTPLSAAAAEGHASVCELLASRGADLLATNADGRTAIHVAAEEGHADVVKVLLPHLRRLGSVDLRTSQSQDEVDEDEVYGLTALHLACINGHHLVAERLLAAGASRTATDTVGCTPLHYATNCGYLACLTLMMGHPGAYLPSPAELDVEDIDGMTPLYLAACGGHHACCAALIAAGADTAKAKPDGSTPLMVAADKGHASICKLLAARGADLLATNADGHTAIHEAAVNGHADVVKVLLPYLHRLGSVDLRTVQSQCPDDDDEDEDEDEEDSPFCLTALHIACSEGHHLVAKRLLAAGASRTATDTAGYTPLHYTAQYGQLACLTLVMGHPGAYLLSTAELDTQSTDGETPLSDAADGGYRACCAALIAAGVDTAKAKPDGSTPLSIAQSRHADKPQLLALLEAHSGANSGTPLVLRCEGCGKPSTEAPRGRLRACAACQGASFCGPECAQRGWLSGHQAECSRIIAAKAAI